MRVSVGRLDLEDTLLHLENRDIERPSSEIVDGDLSRVVSVESVGEGGGGGLVDDSENVETGDESSISSSLSLGVVEVGGNGDDCVQIRLVTMTSDDRSRRLTGVLDGLSEVTLSSLLHLSDDERSNLGRRVLLSSRLEPGISVGVLGDFERNIVDVLLHLSVGVLSTDETLRGEEGVFVVDDGLSLGGESNESLSFFREGDDGRGRSSSLRVLDDSGNLSFL